ncbi:MAG TPA: hypothetical protein VNA20_14990 [Frankiaceae bacterium]|nr:hypothetical protein [Frankiaceae bacterium]
MKHRLLSGLAAAALAATGLVVAATPASANTCTTPFLMGNPPEMGTVTVTGSVAAIARVQWWEHETSLVNRSITLTPTDANAATLTVFAADCSTIRCATASGPTVCTSPIPPGKVRILVEYSPLGGTGSTGYSLTATGMTPTQCNDGVDNDGDNWIDFAGGDPHCFSAADNTEAQVIVAAYGHITITATGSGPPTYIKTGVYNDPSKYYCDMDYTPFVQVVCSEIFNTEIAHDCAAFILTATAPAPGVTGTGNVAGYVGCASGSIKTADVAGSGAARNSAGSATLGRADPVVCRALGINNTSQPSGTYQVDCYEPGVAWPFGRR